MTQQNFDIIINKLNNGLLDAVKDTMYREFGSDFGLTITTYERYDNYYVTLEETNGASTTMCTGSPILRQLFKDTTILVRVYYNEEDNVVSFNVMLSYNHNYMGGSNGHELLSFGLNADNYELIIMNK